MLEHFPLAQHWPNYDSAMTVFRYEIAREVCRDKMVLEIGAASGEGTALFADAAREVMALDYQDLWGASPAAEMPNVKFMRGDALSMPSAWAGRFDVVIAMEFIEHLDNVDKLQRAVFDVLSKDGLFLLSTPNFSLYSDRGDGSRRPVYAKHRREYRAEELESLFLDYWSHAATCGLSQLSFPAALPDSEDKEALMCFAEKIYRLYLGSRYPQHGLFAAASSYCALPLRYCQSFISILCKGATFHPTRLFADIIKGKPAAITTDEAAFESARAILQRRNQHCSEMGASLENVEKHARTLEGIVRDRERRIESLGGI
ncbi:MAG: class I SAM-dependent methyltransferase [Elusimicrobiota bacterium]